MLCMSNITGYETAKTNSPPRNGLERKVCFETKTVNPGFLENKNQYSLVNLL